MAGPVKTGVPRRDSRLELEAPNLAVITLVDEKTAHPDTATAFRVIGRYSEPAMGMPLGNQSPDPGQIGAKHPKSVRTTASVMESCIPQDKTVTAKVPWNLFPVPNGTVNITFTLKDLSCLVALMGNLVSKSAV